MVHDYLGMILDFSKPGGLTVDMIDYIKTIMAEMPKDMEGTAKTPAENNLFKISDNPVMLDKEKAGVFHRMVMQLLYLCQRGRLDVRTAVAFLTNCKALDVSTNIRMVRRTCSVIE